MSTQHRSFKGLSTWLLATSLMAPAVAAQELQTVAEASDWQATATHLQVMELCSALHASSPRVHMEVVGKTAEHRALPILVIADPPVSDPSEVGDRLVAFAWAGIHSGEVCGKPATLMLAREMAQAAEHPLLKHLVVLFMPLLNADGNDRMDPGNRRGQLGPVQGMGTRANAAGLNINRDWMKLDTLEARTVVSMLNRWSPVIAMDLHTTNGTRHRYTLTFDGQRHPAVDEDLRRLTRNDLLQAVRWSIESDTGYRTQYYGNLNRDRTRWTIDPALPRYSTHYVGLRHEISLLSEAYSYATYEDRVRGTIAFVRHSFQWVADHKEQVRRTIQAAEQRAVALGHELRPENLVHLRRQPKFTNSPVTILAYEGEEERDYQCYYNDLSEATLSVPRPWAYLLPPQFKQALNNLELHGIQVRTLASDTQLSVEVYRITERQKAQRTYEGHVLNTVEASKRSETRSVPAGTLVIRTAQPLGTLAALLLEPQSEDSLCTWNFFDDALAQGQDFPVLRLSRRATLDTQPR